MSVIQNDIRPKDLPVAITHSNDRTPLKKIPLVDDAQKDIPVSCSANVSGITPPDDTIGDVMPFALFPLFEGGDFDKEIDALCHIINRLPKYGVKIQTSNKIPNGIIKIDKI
jgi:hypothetical protein